MFNDGTRIDIKGVATAIRRSNKAFARISAAQKRVVIAKRRNLRKLTTHAKLSLHKMARTFGHAEKMKGTNKRSVSKASFKSYRNVKFAQLARCLSSL